MKTKTRLAFFLSILMAASFMTACSFSSSSDNDDDDSNNTSQPDKTVTNVPRTLKIVQLPCDTGIAIAVRNLDGTPFTIPHDENNSYGGWTEYRMDVKLNNGLSSLFINPDKWVCPYVNPNEPVTINVYYSVQMFDGNGLKRDGKDLAWDEITITPTTGFGRVTYDGKVNIEFNKSGDLKVTADSQTLKNYRGDYWNVVTDIATGKDWESLGSWMSNMYVRNDQFGQTFNLWINGGFHRQILENGLIQGFLDSFIEYSYSVSENETYYYRYNDVEGLGYKKGITLDTYESYLQSQGLANPFNRSFVEKFGTVVKYTMDANSSKGRLSYDTDGDRLGKQCLYYACMVELSGLSTNFQNKMPTAGNLENWDDFNFYPWGTIRSYSANVLPEVGSPARNYFVELSYIYDIETKAYKVYVNLLKKGAVYNPNIHIENRNERPIYVWRWLDISGL